MLVSWPSLTTIECRRKKDIEPIGEKVVLTILLSPMSAEVGDVQDGGWHWECEMCSEYGALPQWGTVP